MGGRGHRGDKKETQEDKAKRLNSEMDSYWSKGGIKNDITQKQLDEELQAYKAESEKQQAS